MVEIDLICNAIRVSELCNRFEGMQGAAGLQVG